MAQQCCGPRSKADDRLMVLHPIYDVAEPLPRDETPNMDNVVGKPSLRQFHLPKVGLQQADETLAKTSKAARVRPIYEVAVPPPPGDAPDLRPAIQALDWSPPQNRGQTEKGDGSASPNVGHMMDALTSGRISVDRNLLGKVARRLDILEATVANLPQSVQHSPQEEQQQHSDQEPHNGVTDVTVLKEVLAQGGSFSTEESLSAVLHLAVSTWEELAETKTLLERHDSRITALEQFKDEREFGKEEREEDPKKAVVGLRRSVVKHLDVDDDYKNLPQDIFDTLKLEKDRNSLTEMEARLSKLETNLRRANLVKKQTHVYHRKASVTYDHHSEDHEEGASPHDTEMLVNRTAFDDLSYRCFFEESMWDAVLFMGLSPIPLADNLLTSLLLCINLSVQMSFAIIVWLYLAPRKLDDARIQKLQEWRVHYGHSTEFVEGGHSLAARMCSRDPSLAVSNSHLKVIEMIDEYMPSVDPDFTVGPWLSFIAMYCWTLTVIAEFARVHTIFAGLLRVERANATIITRGKGGRSGIREMSQLKLERYVFFILILAARTVLATSILLGGLKLLSNTSLLGDLILNAVALEFVFSLDERIYHAAAPANLRRFIASHISLPRGGRDSALEIFFKSDYNYLPLINLVASLVISLVAGSIWLISNFRALKDVRAAFCYGNVDFIITRINSPPFIGWSLTKPMKDRLELPEGGRYRAVWQRVLDTWEPDHYTQATASLILSPDMHTQLETDPALHELYFPSLSGLGTSLLSVSKLTISEANARQNPKCEDILSKSFFGGDEEGGQAALKWYLNTPDVTTHCTDKFWAEACNSALEHGQLARVFCPELCNCTTPGSSQVHSGCPSSCERTTTYQEGLRSKHCCSDTPQEVLSNTVAWRHLTRAAKAFYESSTIGSSQIIRDAMRLLDKHGCGGIHMIKKEIGFDGCDEEMGFSGVVQLRYWCPVSCKCTAQIKGCPLLGRTL